MDIRLLCSTFALVFLAELGDKTQLASMAASAGSKAPWSVFAGAALALVTSTLIAVLVGSTLQRLVPGHYIKFAASIIFFIFGTALLVNAFQSRAEAAKKAVPAASRPGVIARLVLEAAAAFERSSGADYRKMAADTADQELRKVFLHLAQEEDGHLRHLLGMTADHGEAVWDGMRQAPQEIAGPAPSAQTLTVIDSAIAHEQATSLLYRSLAQTAPLAPVRAAFARMAEEEESHVRHLQEYRDQGMTRLHA